MTEKKISDLGELTAWSGTEELELDTGVVSGRITIDNLLADHVVGPASSTDNEIARFDLATGKVIQGGSGISLNDAGAFSGYGDNQFSIGVEFPFWRYSSEIYISMDDTGVYNVAANGNIYGGVTIENTGAFAIYASDDTANDHAEVIGGVDEVGDVYVMIKTEVGGVSGTGRVDISTGSVNMGDVCSITYDATDITYTNNIEGGLMHFYGAATGGGAHRMMILRPDGGPSLYYNDIETVEITATGMTIKSDIVITHDGVNAALNHNVTDGNLTLGVEGTGKIKLEAEANGGVSVWPALTILEKSSDPVQPAEGETVVWMSDGTGKGDDGDVMIASTAGGVTNYTTLFDHSTGTLWS